jgi:AraC family transcriptional regulator of adaptative response/methylated-DNA-[protein]-cysteine methyltransferase
MEPNKELYDTDFCWKVVEARDTRYRETFVYGVRSTGIYCRPGCASRQPKREQVLFFANGSQAEAAGFRACKRCQPDQALDQQVELVKKACQLLQESPDGLSLGALGQAVGLSPFHLQRVFKKVMGVSPRQYSRSLRLETFKSEVRKGHDVTQAVYEAGYGSNSRLYEQAKQSLGMTPGTYRRGGMGMEITYTIVDCSLGRMLVAATRQGLCAVSFADNDETVEALLRAEYPAAQFVRDEAGLTEWVASLTAYLEGQKQPLEMPLDLQATAFQLRVWEELRAIPYGETRSYAQVAQAIGRPAAVRAVAHACASNPVAVVTPCHRVVRGDGSLAGYRWGLARKQALLAREKKSVS